MKTIKAAKPRKLEISIGGYGRELERQSSDRLRQDFRISDSQATQTQGMSHRRKKRGKF